MFQSPSSSNSSETVDTTASRIPPCILPRDQWPEILVGPIVRRVDDGTKVGPQQAPPSVSVFLGLSVPRFAQLLIYEGNASPSGRTPILSSTVVAPVSVGASLHLVMPRVESTKLVRGKVYGYDIVLSDTAVGPSASVTTLGSAGLLDDPKFPLGYAKGKLPSFVLPEPLPALRVVHASCRKPHGGGPDALSTLDLILEKNVNKLANRPQQLFLTGDQIYADDVAIALLNTLAPLGRMLLGWQEEIALPANKKEGGKSSVNYTDAAVAPGERSDFLFRQTGKPETHYAANHLLFFGDFCAMYVMAWSPALWLKDSNGDVVMTAFDEFKEIEVPDTFSDKAALIPGQPFDESALDSFTQSFVAAATEQWDSTTPLLDYAKTLPRIRRSLANIATLMIFDDHEVTDDWYLNGELWLRFRGSMVGRRVLRNALMAYAMFQDWGNRPTDYIQSGPYQDLMGKIVYTNTSGINSTNHTCCDSLLDIGPPSPTARPNMLATPHANGRLLWNYAIAWTDHVVCALDTRTWRYFPDSQLLNTTQDALALASWLAPDAIVRTAASAGSELAQQLQEGTLKLNAHLIQKDAMATQAALAAALLSKGGDNKRTLFVISAAPVFGFYIVELLQKTFMLKDGANNGPEESGAEVRDNEPWIGSPEATANLLGFFSAQPTIFLSGDVHYAYSTLVEWSLGNKQQKFLQLCSSAAKNSEPLTEVLALTDHITDAFGSGGLGGAYRVVTLLAGTSIDAGGVIFNADPAAQSRFVEDVEDKVFAVLGDKLGAPVSEVLDLPQDLLDQATYSFKTYLHHPWRLLLGDLLVDAPTDATKLYEILNNPVVGIGCTPTSLEDDISAARNYGQDRINKARAVGHWYEDFRPFASSWLSGFSAMDQRYIGEWNYISVGHANIGLISFEPAAAGKNTVVHELLWYSNLAQNGAPWLWGAESISKCPLLMTRHTQLWPP